MKQLSAAVPRQALHTRKIECTGYQREDGLWEVEGRISDVRTWDQTPIHSARPRPAGEPIHLMSLRLTLDDRFLIVGAEAVTHQAPFVDCDGINDSYTQLVGLRIEAGFSQAVRTRFRGVEGCTHLTELLGPIATTALQLIRPILSRKRIANGEPAPDEGPKPAMLDSCHGWRRGAEPAVIRWGKVGGGV
jgi:hypothetical protein